jgi:serine protease AprX
MGNQAWTGAGRRPLVPWLLGVALLGMLVWRLPAGEIQRAAAEGTVVDERVLADTANGASAHFLVLLAEQADLSAATKLSGKEARGAYVVEQLRATAARSQPAVTRQLDALGVSYRSYWVTNMIAVEGNRQVVEALAANPAVAKIEPDRAIKQLEPAPEPDTSAIRPSAIEWNVSLVGADQVWGMGYTGTGIVVADQDTGFEWNHPALIQHYRGWNGAVADHNYAWWDAIHADINGDGTNPCGFSAAAPCDDHGHGTHTVGTAVGGDGANNQIGVAPGAKWIGCRNMESGVGRPSTYTECFQFFMAPTDLSGNNPQPALAPHVISNSWGCPRGAPPLGEDCNVDSFKLVVENTRAAGIMVVVAAGNNGPGCSTVSDPPSYLDASTTVGATTAGDDVALFSSRGPATADGSNRLKPDIVAPGASIRSSTRGAGYGGSSGTSMATPHVAGAVALLWSARPGLIGNIDATENALFSTTARPVLSSTETCGGVPSTTFPNNTLGWGRLDIRSAVNAVPTALTVASLNERPPMAQRDQMLAGLLLLAAGGLLGLLRGRRA